MQPSFSRRQPLTCRLHIASTILALAAVCVGAAHAESQEAPAQRNRHGVGFALDASLLASDDNTSHGGLTGFAYRRYFGDIAVQIDALPIYRDRGDYMSIFAGVQVIDYALVWGSAGRTGLVGSATALRLTGAASVHASRSTTQITIPDENCQTATCQQITASKPKVKLAGSVAAGFGFELGAVQQSGFSVAADLMMTVVWDDKGFYGAYPVPYLTGMYSW